MIKLWCAAFLVAGLAGCTPEMMNLRPLTPAVPDKPAAEASAAPAKPRAPVTAAEVNEANARDKAQALREEMDLELQTMQEKK
jgi:hypothetical protein